MHKLKTLVKEKTYEKSAKKLCPNIKRFDEMTEGIEWALAHNPEIWPFIPNTKVQVIKAEAEDTTLTILFIDEGDIVRLLGVRCDEE